jgi:hypothetical protein
MTGDGSRRGVREIHVLPVRRNGKIVKIRRADRPLATRGTGEGDRRERRGKRPSIADGVKRIPGFEEMPPCPSLVIPSS